MRALLLVLFSSLALAQTDSTSTSVATAVPTTDVIKFSTRFITAKYKYDEPGLMTIKGALYGVGIDGETIASSGLLLKGELDLLAGSPRYDGALMSGEPIAHTTKNYYYEVRGLIGKEVPQTANINFIFLSGLGHRYLNDNGQSDSSYEREQTYNYIPFIMALDIQATDTLKIKTFAEVDLFLNGQNKSHLEDVDPSYPTLKFNQSSGSGSRIGAVASKQFRSMIGFARLDFSSWNIDDSEVKYGFVEPKNKTTMTALALGLIF